MEYRLFTAQLEINSALEITPSIESHCGITPTKLIEDVGDEIRRRGGHAFGVEAISMALNIDAVNAGVDDGQPCPADYRAWVAAIAGEFLEDQSWRD